MSWRRNPFAKGSASLPMGCALVFHVGQEFGMILCWLGYIKFMIQGRRVNN